MPVYTYRRADGTTFDLRQKFTDDALSVDPQTGQSVTRVVQAAGVIFKGSGFYVNDSKSSSKSSMMTPAKSKDESSSSGESSSGESSSSSDSGKESSNNGGDKSASEKKAETKTTVESKTSGSKSSETKSSAPAT